MKNVMAWHLKWVKVDEKDITLLFSNRNNSPCFCLCQQNHLYLHVLHKIEGKENREKFISFPFNTQLKFSSHQKISSLGPSLRKALTLI